MFQFWKFLFVICKYDAQVEGRLYICNQWTWLELVNAKLMCYIIYYIILGFKSSFCIPIFYWDRTAIATMHPVLIQTSLIWWGGELSKFSIVQTKWKVTLFRQNNVVMGRIRRIFIVLYEIMFYSSWNWLDEFVNMGTKPWNYLEYLVKLVGSSSEMCCLYNWLGSWLSLNW